VQKILFCLLLIGYTTQAQQIILFPEKPTTTIGDRLLMLVDSSASLKIEDFLSQKNGHGFVNSDKQVINLGLLEVPIWIKFELYSAGTVQWYLEIANPLLNEIEVYQVQDSSVVEFNRIGFSVPFDKRVIKYRNPIIPFFLSEGESKTFYLKIKAFTYMSIPLRVGSDKAIINSIHQSDALYNLGFGAFLMMLLFNFLIYISSKDRSYLLYCFYLIASIFLNGHLLGVNYEVLWPSHPSLNFHGTAFFTAFVGLTLIPFSVEFLQLRNFLPRLSKYIYWLLLIPLTALVFSMIGEVGSSIVISRFGSIIFIIVFSLSALLVYRKGYLPARAYLIAFVTFLVFVIIYLFRYNDDYLYGQFATSALQIGTIAQMALLSIALSDRINLYKKQNEAAKREKEILILEQNRILEAKVGERTAQLEAANLDLLNSQRILIENAELLGQSNQFLEQTQKRLIEKDKRLIEAQNLAKLASYQINVKTNEFYCSETIYDVLGLVQGAELTPESLEKIIFQEDLPAVQADKNLAIAEHRDFNVSYRIVLSSGKLGWIQELGHPSYDQSGQISKISATLQNITERKESEEKINEAYRLLKIQNDNITDSIRYAKRIQSAILPDEDELVETFGEAFVLYMPKDIVSGDFYWFKRYNEKQSKIILAAADCTGHGVPGALMSIVSHNLLRETIELRKIHQPAKILEDLRLGIRSTLKQDENQNRDGLDISLCMIDLLKNTLTVAGSYTPVYYFLDGSEQIEAIKPNKLSIGGSEITLNQAFEQTTIDLKDKMVIYLFSDGYQDQFGGPEGKKFMAHRFRKLLCEVHSLPLSQQKQILESTIRNWMQNQKQIDDIMVIGIKVDFNILQKKA
jgi:serine phosphatase RsbU (regulator of sigma subunit)